jgi:hypothetical protein
MKLSELQNALELQKRAYSLLLWLAKQGSACSGLLDAEALSTPALCERWFNQNLNYLPREIRVDPGEIERFARMLSSFFNTSFHFEKTELGPRLVRGQKYTDIRHKRHVRRRAEERACELVRLALRALVLEERLTCPEEVIDEILHDSSLAAALHLYAYGCELVRRTEFATQGRPVHHLWLELDEVERKTLTAETIWKGRAKLVNALKRQTHP